jgi:hypothetical protein
MWAQCSPQGGQLCPLSTLIYETHAGLQVYGVANPLASIGCFLARHWIVSSDQPEKQRDACPLLELSPLIPTFWRGFTERRNR